MIFLDQITKRWIEQNLPLHESIVPFAALEDFFTITHFWNTGAAFGLFRDQGFLFVAIAIVVVVAIIVYSRHLPHGQRLVQIALGLQLGGAVGNNLIDRLRLGHVTDFLYFHKLPIINRPWPAFNIADMAIVGGVILLGWVILREGQEEQKNAVPGEAGEQQA